MKNNINDLFLEFKDFGEENPTPYNKETFNELQTRIKNYFGEELSKIDSQINRKKILWQNNNSDVIFNSQKITLSSDDYDVLEIFWSWNVSAGATNYCFSTRTLKGYSFQIGFDQQNNYNRSRQFTRLSDTEFTIADATNTDKNGTATVNNNLCVPIKIIGIKF